MNNDVDSLASPKPQLLAPGEKEVKRAKKPRLRKRLIITCIMLPILLLIIGCVWLYIGLFQPRFFSGVQTLEVTEPVCGTWQAMSGSIFGSKVPRIDDFAVIRPDDVWGIRSGSTVYHWDGFEWRDIKLPLPSNGTEVNLNRIASLPSGEAWIVGSSEDPDQKKHSLTYHLKNDQWMLESSPDVEQSDTSLLSVSGIATNDVWAVGNTTKGYQSRALAMHWDGGQWLETASINDCAGNQQFYGVKAIATTDVWAIGGCSEGTLGSLTDTTHTMVQHWDGKDWKIVPSPNHPPSQFINSSTLFTIDGTSPVDLWAVGDYWDSDRVGYYWTQSMLQHWDGTNWTEVHFTHPGFGTTSNLSDVIAISPDDVWAIGFYSRGWLHPFGIHWDGKNWKEVPMPNPLAEGEYDTIASLGADQLWAMGFGFDNEDGDYYGLLARFEGQPCPTPSQH